MLRSSEQKKMAVAKTSEAGWARWDCESYYIMAMMGMSNSTPFRPTLIFICHFQSLGNLPQHHFTLSIRIDRAGLLDIEFMKSSWSYRGWYMSIFIGDAFVWPLFGHFPLSYRGWIEVWLDNTRSIRPVFRWIMSSAPNVQAKRSVLRQYHAKRNQAAFKFDNFLTCLTSPLAWYNVFRPITCTSLKSWRSHKGGSHG